MTDPAQIYLSIDATASAPERLTAVLARAPIASLLIKPATAGQAIDLDIARTLVEIAQDANVAALIEDDADMARGLRADGVHLSADNSGAENCRQAREIVGGRAIVGATAGRLRHDAMEIGECGADYVAFEPLPAEAGDSASDDADTDPLSALCERIEWWSEIFEIPSVVSGASAPADAERLADAGADFIAIHCPSGKSLDETVSSVSAILAAIDELSTAEASQ